MQSLLPAFDQRDWGVLPEKLRVMDSHLTVDVLHSFISQGDEIMNMKMNNRRVILPMAMVSRMQSIHRG